MKLYVVEYSSGQYDDFSRHIEGIFTDAAKAEEYAAKIRADIAAMKDEKRPTYHSDYFKMSHSERIKYNEWYNRQQKAKDFNDATVTELLSDVEFNEYKKEDWL